MRAASWATRCRHAYGAAFDNPDLLVACVVGDGEAETGPLAGSWQSNMFLNPARDGAVLPILHLNGYKIANPTVLARIPAEELLDADRRLRLPAVRRRPGDDPEQVHQQLAATLDRVVDEIAAIQRRARAGGDVERPRWPMIVLRTPKGWTGPKEVDGKQVEGTFRAHQVPIANVRGNPEHLAELEDGCAATGRRSCSTTPAARSPNWPRCRRGRPADERQPARQRRAAAARPGPARLP